MTHNQITDHVRKFIQDRFRELGAHDDEGLTETLLVRGGFYCGRRFDQDTCSAVWFIEEHEVKIHDADGRILEVHQLGECLEQASVLRAAETAESVEPAEERRRAA